MYTLDLGLSEKKRWNQILEEKKDVLIELGPKVRELIADFRAEASTIETKISFWNALGQIWYSAEMDVFAKAFGIKFYEAVVLQLFFEMKAGSTAIVTKVEDRNVMFRAMDHAVPWFKDLLINLKVVKKGKVLYYATTWLGYVGMLTTLKPGMNAVAINYRSLPQDLSIYEYTKNEGSSLMNKFQIGIALRYANENYNDETDFLRYLKNVKLITPCYITVCSIHNTPRLLVRDREAAHIFPQEKIIATNCDPDKEEPNLFESTRRRNINVKDRFTSRDELMTALSIDPIVTERIGYISYLDPSNVDASLFN